MPDHDETLDIKNIMREAGEDLRIILADVAPDLHFHMRAMFGGMGYFANGAIFAAWLDGETVCLKAHPDDMQDLLAAGGRVSNIMKKYVHLPRGWIVQHEILAPYITRAVQKWVR